MPGEALAAPPSCGNHPERLAVARCVRCRAAVCGECTTRFQGINHCSRCIRALAATPSDPSEVSGAATALRVAAAYGTLAVLLYALAVTVAS